MTLPTYAVTDRFVLHAGYSCNARCSFCYYLPEIESGKARDFSTEELLSRIDLAARFGKRAIDVSGGEPTIRPDLPRLLTRCREHGFHTVTVITNGIRTAQAAYVETLKAAGLTEGLFSLHGATAAIHDGLTGRPGSFERLLASVANFRALGLGVRINSVVNGRNVDTLDDLFALVTPLAPSAFNLLVFNPAEQAAELPGADGVRLPDYTTAGLAISRALDAWKGRLPAVNVRFLPFCFLRDHPECVKTQWQKAHEDHEWDPFLNVLLQKGRLAAAGATVLGALLPGRTPRYRALDTPTRISRGLSAFRMKLHYRQGKPCGSCALRAICPGLPRDHVERFGFPDVAPIPGATVTDPLHFVKGQTALFASLRP